MGVGPITAAVFLDRDGTLIGTRVEDGVPRPIESAAELALLPGVPDGIDRLRREGFVLVLVTNQPDVARGTLERRVVEQIHERLQDALGLDLLQCCYHDDADGCACRKPQPGMLIDAANELGVRLADSFMVGDRWRDIAAGKAAGCTTVLLRQSYSGSNAEADFEVASFPEAVDTILKCQEGRA